MLFVHGSLGQSFISVSISLPDSATVLKQAVELTDEDPQTALLKGHQGLKHARLKSNKEYEAFAFLTLANAYIKINELDRATFYLNALETLANEIDLKEVSFDVLCSEVALNMAQGKEKDARLLIENALKESISIKNFARQIRVLLLKVIFLRDIGSFEDAKRICVDALELAEKYNENGFKAEILQAIAGIHFRQSKFSESKEWYIKALEAWQQKNDTVGYIEALKSVSIVCRDLGHFDESNTYLSEALRFSKQIGKHSLVADVYNLFGSLSLRRGNQNQAINYYNLSLEIRESIGYLSSMATSLENLSRVYLQLNQFDESVKLLNRAIGIREQLNDYRSVAAALNDLGNVFSQKGELAEALKYYLNSLRIRQERADDSEIARSLTNIGLTYRKLGSHKNAIRYFEEALSLIPEKTDPIGKAYVYVHLGNTLRDIDNPGKALKNYLEALELRKKAGNKPIIAQSLRSVAGAHSDLENFSEAKKLLKQSLDIYNELNDQRGIADCNNELGNVLLNEGNLEHALVYFESASSQYANLFDMERRGLCLRKIGEIHHKMGRYNQAAENLNLALKIALSSQNGKLIETTLLSLYDFHLSKGDYKEALQFYRKHINVRDSLQSVHTKEAVWQASLDLELDKKASEIRAIEGEVDKLRQEAKMKAYEIERQKLIRNFLALASILILVIASASFYGYLIIRKKNFLLNETNTKLAESKRELQSTLKTKDKLFSIIAHDLKSPFTALVGLTEIMSTKASSLGSDEVVEYSGFVNESSNKLLTLIENLLDWSRSQTGKIQLEPNTISVQDIINQTIDLLKMQAESKEISINVNIENNLKILADFNTIYTAIRNLVSNAIKFTHPNGMVWLSAYRKDSMAVVEVKDSGIGISNEMINKLFDLETSISTKGTRNESGTGLGLILCKEFVELNNGIISVESELGKGTTFFVKLPIH